MKNGQVALYMVIGVLIGIILMLLFYNVPPNLAIAGAKTDGIVGSANGMIALATQTRSDTSILWVLDTVGKKLALYDFYNEDDIRFRAARDVQYDFGLPNGGAYVLKAPKSLTPLKVKAELEKWKEPTEKEK